jgi:hypothetical protein
LFFSEAKNQKTFISGARGKIPAHSLKVGASIVEAAEEQKSFAAFLQKRRVFLNLLICLYFSKDRHAEAGPAGA